MPEEMVVRPLTGTEVQEAVIHKIRESMAKTCHLLSTNGYTAFRAEIEIHLTLSDYGENRFDNHKIIAQEGTLPPVEDPSTQQYEIEVTMEPAPPNQVLIESGQKVDVQTTEDGKKVIKSFRYTPRKTTPPPPPREIGQR